MPNMKPSIRILANVRQPGMWVVAASMIAGFIAIVIVMGFAIAGAGSDELDVPLERIITEVTAIGPPTPRRTMFTPPTIYVRVAGQDCPVARGADRIYSHLKVGDK